MEKDCNNIYKGMIKTLSTLNNFLLRNRIKLSHMRNLYSVLARHRGRAIVALWMMVFITSSAIGNAQGSTSIEGYNYISKIGGHIISSQENLTVLPNQEIEYVLELRNVSTETFSGSVIEIKIPYYANFHSMSAVYYQGTTGTDPVYTPGDSVIRWNLSSIPGLGTEDLLAKLTYTLVSSQDCYALNATCDKEITVTGTFKGTGTTSGQITVPFVYGYRNVIQSPTNIPTEITIDASSFVANCISSGQEFRQFVYLEDLSLGATIPVSDISSNYPFGSRYYDTINTSTGLPISGSVEYTSSNGFPKSAGKNSYYAVSSSDCWQKFFINVLDTSDIVFCAGQTLEDAVAWANDWDAVVANSGKWIFGGSVINDLSTKFLTLADSGQVLQYEATSLCGNSQIFSNGIKINVYDAPEITDTTYLLSYCIGHPLTASVVVDPHGSPIISYVWTLDGVVVGNGASLNNPILSASDNGKVLKLVVTNSCGSDSMSINIRVVNTPIALTCPANTVYADVPTEQDVCYAAVNYTSNISPGAGTNVSYRYEFSGSTTGSGSGTGSGENFNLGSTTVKVVAYNDCSIDSCEFIIVVKDHQTPMLSCVGNQNEPPISGQDYYIVSGTEFDATATDNCSGVITLTHNINQSGVSNTSLAGAKFYLGETTVKWIAIDANGNEDSCKFTVTVGSSPVIEEYPSDFICGDYGVVKLSVVSPDPALGFATYQWYREDTPISGATDSILFVNEPDGYKCELTYIVSGTSEFSNIINIKKTSSLQPQPSLVSIPASGNLCAGDGKVYLYIANADAYTNPVFMWYGADTLITNSGAYYYAAASGTYHVIVVEGGCAYKSNSQDVSISSTSINAPTISSINSETDICGEDGMIILQVTSTHTGISIKYTWFKDNAPIANSDRPIYEVRDSGSYKVMVEIDGCAAESSSIDVKKTGTTGTIKEPKLDIFPASAEICTGGKVYIGINNVAAYTNPTFKWFRNDTLQTSLTDSFVIVDITGKYFVIVMDGQCITRSIDVDVESGSGSINKPIVGNYPTTNIICGSDGVVVLQLENEIDYTGLSSVTYQWYNGNAVVAGANHIVFSAYQDGDYYLLVTSDQCVAISDTFKVRMQSVPSIAEPQVTMVPSDGKIVLGSSSAVLTLTNTTAYTNPTYQWYKDTLPIAGAVSPIYTATTEGLYQLLVVENNNCARWSDTFRVQETSCIIALPELAMIPTSGKVCEPYGSVLIQLNNVSAYVNPTYQWYKGNTLLADTTPTMEVTEAGEYRIRVTADISLTNNNRCDLYSNPETVVLDNGSFTEKPVIARSPENGVICGDEGSVLLTFTNSSKFSGATFSWVKNGYEIPNETGLTYLATDSGKYQILVRDGDCAALSLVENVIKNTSNINKPIITSTSNGTNICQNNGSILMRVTNGSLFEGMNYQWYKNNVAISGATTNYYNALDSGIYRVQVIDGICSSVSDSIRVTKDGNGNIDQPVLSKIPPHIEYICDGDGEVYYYVSNSASYNSATYIWFKDTGIVKTSGEPYYRTKSNGIYFVQVIEGSCSSVSVQDTLKSNSSPVTQPVIVSTSGGTNICSPEGTIVLRLNNSSVYTGQLLSYQWYRNDTAITINGTQMSYTATEAGDYRLQIVVAGLCSSISDSIRLTKDGSGNIVKPVLVSDPPRPLALCLGSGVIKLSVSNANSYTNAIYHWHNDTGIVQSGNSPVLYVDASGHYSVEVVADGCSSISDIDTVNLGSTTIDPALISTNTRTICGDTGVAVISLDNDTDYSNATYQWYRNDTLIANATGKIYVATTGGSYRIKVMEGSCTTYSDSINIIETSGLIHTPLTSLFPPDGIIVGSGGSVTINVSNTGDFTNATYAWYKEDTKVGIGTSYVATETGVYYVLVTEDNGCSSISAGDTIRSTEARVPRPIVHVSPSDTICGNEGSVVLTVTNTHEYVSPIYRWFNNGSQLAGGDSSVYIAKVAGIYTVIVTDTGFNSQASLPDTIYKVVGDIETPLLSRSSSGMDLCSGSGSFILSVSNSSIYSMGTEYVWYHGSWVVQRSDKPIYIVQDTGTYWVQVIEGHCSSVSDIDTVKMGNTSIKEAKIASLSGTNLCGTNGIVTLYLTNETDYSSPVYTWYRNDTLLVGENNYTLNVYTPSDYRIQVEDGSCSSVSDSIRVTQDGSVISNPILVRNPLNSDLCAGDGIVYLYVSNRSDYTSPVYTWFRNDTLIQRDTMWHYDATVAGLYMVEVTEGLCSSWDSTRIEPGNGSGIVAPVVTSRPVTNEICGERGVVVLTVSNSAVYTNATYQWYRNYVPITTQGTDSVYFAEVAGLYRVQVMEGSCTSFSDTLRVKSNNSLMERPILFASGDTLCTGGSVLLSVDNTGDYFGFSPQYIWYKGTEVVQDDTLAVYEATEDGEYRVQVILDDMCSSVSTPKEIYPGGTVVPPVIASVSGGQVICGVEGSVILELSNYSSYGNIAIQWYKNNKLIAGAVSEHYKVEVKDTGIYRVYIKDGACSAFSDTMGVYFDINGDIKAPKVVSSSPGLMLCYGGSILLRVNNTGDYSNDARYVWYLGSSIVQDSSLSVYVAKTPGIYYVQVVDGECTAHSTNDTVRQSLSSIDPAVIVSTSGNTNICQGQSEDGIVLMLSPTVSYGNNATYQWYKNNVAISGADTTLYIARDSGRYILEVINGSCSSVSNEIRITKDGSGNIVNPVLSRIPQQGDLCVGGDVYYYVSNASVYGNARYNWFRGNALIQSDTLSYYRASRSGVYYVEVVSGTCSSISGFDTLKDNTSTIDRPVIVSTAGTNLCQGDGSVVLRLNNQNLFGSGALYQWYKNNVPIVGATSTVYTVVDSGHYRIMVIDGSCSSMSDSIRITKTGTTSITQPQYSKQPDTKMICLGGSIVYTISNPGSYSSNAVYMWFRDSIIVQQDKKITYEATTSGKYYVEVIDGLCSSVSRVDTIELSNNSAPLAEIESVSGGYEICAGDVPQAGSVMLWLKDTLSHSGSTYQWYRNGIAISGATTIIYNATDSGYYHIQVMNGECSSTSEGKQVYKNTGLIIKPVLTKTPLNGQICEGSGRVLLTVNNASIYNAGSEYIWYYNNHVVARGIEPTYIAKEAGTYLVQVVEGSCTSVSAPSQISSSTNTIELPLIVSTSGETNICPVNRGSIVMRLINGDDYSTSATYQWYKNNILVPGATGRIYSTTDSGEYRIMVRDGICSSISDSIKVTKEGTGSIRRPLLAKYPTNGMICEESGSVVIYVTNTTNYSTSSIYQWFNDTGIVQSSMSPSYAVTVAGDYFVQVVEGSCSSESAPITVEENSASTPITKPNIVSTSGDTNICQTNGSILMRVTNGSAYSTNVTYQWYKNGSMITGATNNYYNALDSGIYRVQVIDGICSSVSDSIRVTKKGNSNIGTPILSKQPNSSTICIGGEITYHVSNSSDYQNATYIWFNDTGIVQNDTSSSYLTKQPGIYFVQVIEGSCSSVSRPDTIKSGGIIIPAQISSVSGGQVICGPDGTIILQLANKDQYGSISIQWYKDNKVIPDAIFETYEVHIADTGVYKVYIQDGECGSFSDTIRVRYDINGDIKKPVLLSSSPTLELCNGGSILLSVSNTNDYAQNARYVWYKEHSIIQDSTLSYYEVKATGIYYVQVVDGDCSSRSKSDTIVSGGSITTPIITAIPESNEVCGTTGVVILRITNAGSYTNPTYQWYKNNVIIPGETKALYEATDSGYYKIHVTEGSCTAFSTPEVKVTKDNSKGIEPPILFNQSQTTELCTGGNILLVVDNTGDYGQGARYVWYRGDQLVQDSIIPYYEVKVTGVYFVQVVDGECSARSGRDETITPGGNIEKPLISAVPVSNTICGNNGIVMLTLENVNDYVNPSIQWYRNNKPISGATDVIYEAHDTGSYRVGIKEGTCSTLSDTAIKVTKDPNSSIEIPRLISTSPNSKLCTGGSILLTVANIGDYGLNARYIWYRGTAKVQDGILPYYEVLTTGIYFVQVVDGNCSSRSKSDTITSGTGNIEPPTFNSSPISNTICGDTGVVILTFTNETDYTNPTIQWYKNNVLIPGENKHIYVARTSGLYRLHVIDGDCSAFSEDTIRLIKNNSNIALPVVLSSSQTGVICGPDGSVLLTVKNTASYSPGSTRYVWYREDRIVQNDTLSSYETQDAGNYFVHVIDGSCSAVSATITLTKTINNFDKPVVAYLPASLNICGDTGVVFLSVSNTSVYTNPTYQWYRGSTLLQGETHSYYSAVDSGNYRVLVIDGNCSAFSVIVPVTKTNTDINKPIIASSTPNGKIYGGNPVKLSLRNEAMYSSPQYYWYRDDMTLTLLTTDPICTTNIAGKYKLLLVDGNCAAWSNVLILTDTACNTPSFVADNMDVCDSMSFDLALTIDTMSVNSVMKYYSDNLAQIQLPSSEIEPHHTKTYYLQSTDTITGCKSAIVPVVITVVPKPALPSAVADMIYVNGATVSSYTFTGTTPNASYIWAWVSGDTIIGLPKSGVNIMQGFTAINTDTVVKEATYMYTTVITNTGTASCYASDTGYFKLIILPTPDVNIHNDNQIICSGQVIDTVSFTGRVQNTVYSWTRTSGSYVGFPSTGTGNIQDSILINKGSSPITLTYQVTPTFTYRGVTSYGTPKYFNITINPEPVLSSVPDMEYCPGTVVAAYQFSGTAGMTYSWTRIGGDSVGLKNSGTGSLPSFTATNTTGFVHTAIYEVTAYYTANNLTCDTKDTFLITVNPHTTIDAVADQELCNHDPLSIQFTGTGNEYKWEHVSGDVIGNLPFAGTGDINIASVTNSTQRTLSAVYKATAGYYSSTIGICDGDATYFTFTVNPTPVLNSIAHAGTICSGTNFNYTATSLVQGVTYAWTRIADPDINGGNVSSGNTPYINEVLNNTSGSTITVTYEFTLTVGICSETSLVTVDVLPSAQLEITYLNDACTGDSTVLIPYTTTSTATMYYTITFSTASLNAGFKSITTPTLLPASPLQIVLPSHVQSGIFDGIIHVQVGNCVENVPFGIQISKPARITTQPVSSLNLCDGEDNLSLSVVADGDNLSYQWYHNGMAIAGATSSTYIEPFTSELEGKYYVEVTGSCGIAVSDTVEVSSSKLAVEEKWDDVLYVPNFGNQYVSFRWYKNGVAIATDGASQYYTDPNGFVGTYRVRAYFADGSYEESCSITLNRAKAHKTVLFPNPVQRGGEYKIVFDGEYLDNAVIEVFDAVGKLLETHTMTGDQIQLSAWYAAGSYTIRVITKDQNIRVKKLIVE